MAKTKPLALLLLVMPAILVTLWLPKSVGAEPTKAQASFENRPYVALDDAKQDTYELPSAGTLILKTVLALTLIGGLTYVGVRFLQKSTAFKGNSQWISIYDAQPLGQNKSLYLAEIAGRLMVLGVTDHGISILTEIGDEEMVETIRQEARQGQERLSSPGSFGRILKSVSEQVGGDKLPASFNSNLQSQVDRLRKLAEGVSPDQGRKDEHHG